MHRISTSLLVSGLVVSALSAQNGAPPGMKKAAPNALTTSIYFSTVDNANTNLWDLKPPLFAIAGRSITQVSCGTTGIAGLQPGEYHMCMTTSRLDSAWVANAGGVAGSDELVMGKVTWNSGQPVFTPTTLAAKLNSSAAEFGLMIDGKNGTRAAFDRSTGPFWSARTNKTQQFDTPVPLNGAGGVWVDPAPGHMDGVLGCFWVDSGNTISWAPVNETFTSGQLTAASLDNSKKVIVIQTNNQPHSPTPLFNIKGDANGMWYSRLTGSDSDEYFSGFLPDTTGGQLVDDNTSWSNNGGVAGSRFLAAYSGHYNTLIEGQGSYMICGSNISVGASAVLDISICSPVGTPPLFTSLLAVGLQLGPQIALPGVLGVLGLNPNLMIVTSGPAGNGLSETATTSFPANNAALKGQTIHLQALTMPLQGHAPALTNTCSPSFK